MVSGSLFYDCIRIAVFVCENGFEPHARPSREIQAKALEDWHTHMRKWLVAAVGEKAPDKRTTYRWIDPVPEKRCEPRNHLKQIIQGTREYVHLKYANHSDKSIIEKATPLISGMCKLALLDYIELSKVAPFQLREILPEYSEISQFMFPRTKTRHWYETRRTSLIDEVERSLSNTKLLIYRCRSSV